MLVGELLEVLGSLLLLQDDLLLVELRDFTDDLRYQEIDFDGLLGIHEEIDFVVGVLVVAVVCILRDVWNLRQNRRYIILYLGFLFFNILFGLFLLQWALILGLYYLDFPIAILFDFINFLCSSGCLVEALGQLIYIYLHIWNFFEQGCLLVSVLLKREHWLALLIFVGIYYFLFFLLCRIKKLLNRSKLFLVLLFFIFNLLQEFLLGFTEHINFFYQLFVHVLEILQFVH